MSGVFLVQCTKRNVENGENWLFKEFLRIVKILEPSWVVFENVQGIVDTAGGTFRTQVADGVKSCGYHVWTALLNAMHFGVPQDRTRFFLVGRRNGTSFKFPRRRATTITVDDAIRDLPRLQNGASECWKQYGRARPSAYGCGCGEIVEAAATIW